jgi:outer membrane protein
MRATSGLWRSAGIASIVASTLAAGCQTPDARSGEPRAAQRPTTRVRTQRLVGQVEDIPRLDGPAASEPAGRAASPLEDMRQAREAIQWHLPDPEDVPQLLKEELEKPRRDRTITRHLENVIKRAEALRRPHQARLTLRDCIQRALRYSYGIRSDAYGPAIETTRVVEAEAAFDAVYFLNLTSNKQDRPSGSELQGTLTEVRSFDSGVRKLLSVGTQIQASYNVSRTFTNLIFQTLNPQWFNQFIVELRQPFLRGFGLDFNRAQIETFKLDRRISFETFRRRLQERLLQVEASYWQLKERRAEVITAARTLSAFERIFNIIESRKDFDTYVIQRGQIRSRLELQRAAFAARLAALRKEEKNLLALLNDPTLLTADDIEIVPVDPFRLDPLVVDRLGEVQAALDNRPDLKEGKFTIDKARIAIGVAKNQALPKFDVVFRYIVDGLGGNWGGAFSQLSQARYHEYYVGLEFEWPIGNRGPEAAIRRARLQQSQAVAVYGDLVETAIKSVLNAIYDVQASYIQIVPTLRAAEASEDQLRAIVARQLAKDPANLEVELNATESLGASRDSLAQRLVEYNVAIVQLEQQKGTLLDYYNIQIREPHADRPLTTELVNAP